MWDEDELGAALRGELAQQNPPTPHGDLRDAVSRGRRRRRRHQFGAAMAAVVAVAGVATVVVGAGAVTSGGQDGGQDVAASGTSSTGANAGEVSWPRAGLSERSPNTTWTPAPTARPPAGWPTGPVPRCEVPDTTDRDLDSVRLDLSALQERVRETLIEVKGVPPVASTTIPPGSSSVPLPDGVGLLVEKRLPPTGSDASESFTYTVDVADAGGTGSVELTFGRFTGDPLAAADAQAFDTGNCRPPKRHVLADGTVLQVYDVVPSDPFASQNQTLRIYRPDGRLHSLSVRNFGSPDFTTNRQDTGNPHRVGAGRPTLPLTEAQLAELGLGLVG
ncbi:MULTISPECIES: hypothetical protein [unclassified Saccharothrix]|uniref:hypothetical protein n=1 Tax=unclassified Saccharothrix TaxID=2593673 RepID=UPI00307E11C6